MKKALAMSLVMALWATGAYMLGHKHGKSGVEIALPSVKVEWAPKKSEEPKAAEVKQDEVVLSNHCDVELQAVEIKQ